jgi:predicted transposase YbfD/YdcC
MAATTSRSEPGAPTLLRHFADLKDQRRSHRRRHLLTDIIAIAICAVLANAQDWQQVAAFGRARRDWLQRFLKLPHGIPSHDTFERVFDALDPHAVQARFRNWVAAIADGLRLGHVAIDGKTLRGSRSAKLGPLHLVSAWASAQQLLLGQVAVAAKSNEITAIPELLDVLDLDGALVTIDAIGCQKEIAAKIVARGGDYALAVKGNQERLLVDIQAALAHALDGGVPGAQLDTDEDRQRSHGRDEYRCTTVLHNTAGIRGAAEWTGLTTVGMCHRQRTAGGVATAEVHYFIGSKVAGARFYGQGLRSHWSVENQLHWRLDVTFREDGNRVQRRNGAENLALVRRLVLLLLLAHPAKMSLARKRYTASLDTDFLAELLFAADNSGNL